MYAPIEHRPAGTLVILMIIVIVVFSIAYSSGVFGPVTPIPPSGGTAPADNSATTPLPLTPTPDIQQTQAAQASTAQAEMQAYASATAVAQQQAQAQAAFAYQATAQSLNAQATQVAIYRERKRIDATATANSNAEALKREASENQLRIDSLMQEAIAILAVCMGVMVAAASAALIIRALLKERRRLYDAHRRMLEEQARIQKTPGQAGGNPARKGTPTTPRPELLPTGKCAPARRKADGNEGGSASFNLFGDTYPLNPPEDEDISNLPWCE